MAEPGVFASARLAYSDTWRAARAMPVLAFIFVIAGAGYALVEGVYGIASAPTPSMSHLWVSVLLTFAAAVLFAPVYIAIHRFIILGEAAPGYAFDPKSARLRAYCLWSLAIVAVGTIPGSAALVAIEGELGLAVMLALIVAGFAVAIRFVLLFSAIAVDAPGATLRNAAADTYGSFWRIVAILILILIPLIIVPTIATLAMDEEQDSVVLNVTWSFISFCSGPLVIVATSRLFQSLGRHLNTAQPPS